VTQSVNVLRYFAQAGIKTHCPCGRPRRPGAKDSRCLECHNSYHRQYRLNNMEKCRAIAKASYQRIGRETRRKTRARH
jgi:hypothetical protein